MPNKKPIVTVKGRPEACECGAPKTGYVDPTSVFQADEVVRAVNFDPRTMKSYFLCKHGNEFEYAQVRE